MFWTADKDELLKRTYQRGWSALVVAFPGASKGAVYHRINRLRLSRKPREDAVETRAALSERMRRAPLHLGKFVRPVEECGGVSGKACASCKTWKPLEAFTVGRNGAGGRRNACRACETIYARLWKRAHSDRSVAAAMRWQKAHPDVVRAIRLKAHSVRRAKIASGDVGPEELRLRIDEFAGRCAYCMAPATTIDHVQSLARNGKHEIDNIVPACKPCNMKKHAMSLLEFLMRRHSQKGK